MLEGFFKKVLVCALNVLTVLYFVQKGSEICTDYNTQDEMKAVAVIVTI